MTASRAQNDSRLFMGKGKKKGSGGGKGFGGGGMSPAAALKELQKDSFPYAGAIRPGQQSPQRTVLDNAIVKPDYAETGIPKNGNSRALLPWLIEVKTDQEIEKMRAAGKLARQVLDMAGQAVAPGVTTDEIDKLVHEETVKVRCESTSEQ